MPVAAHGHLDSAEPAEGATLAVAPDAITLGFTEALEPALSTITVTDAAGAVIQTGAPEVEDGRILRVTLPALPPGVYKVDWKVTSVDTHSTSGSYGFTVK
ncbi:copper resistance CopC family protein [Paenirhodobacter sp.]|uniref:copper resistance CopC family protein n=1 Tax=Paenirhodobacter sp. TaxID=1965326 RepID=UPI003B3E4285